MLLNRLGPALDFDTLEWYMLMGIYDDLDYYFVHYYYVDNHWSEPVIISKNTRKVISGDELNKISAFLKEHESGINRWFKEESPLFFQYLHLSNDLELISIEPKNDYTDIATFSGTELKIGIYFFNDRPPSFTFEGKNYNGGTFSDSKHVWILKKYPNLVKQIIEAHPKRLLFLF